jgi:hypothetical protein
MLPGKSRTPLSNDANPFNKKLFACFNMGVCKKDSPSPDSRSAELAASPAPECELVAYVFHSATRDVGRSSDTPPENQPWRACILGATALLLISHSYCFISSFAF